MTGNFVQVGGELVPGTSMVQANSVCTRDGDGNTRFNRAIAQDALQSLGGLLLGVAAKTGNHTATAADFLIAFNATGGVRTCTLPAASSSTGLILAIAKTDASVNRVTIDANLSETINGETEIYLTLQNEVVVIECDGGAWRILFRYVPETTTTKNAAFSIDGSANVYLCTMGSAYTITFPPAAHWKGKPIAIIKVDNAAFGAVADGDGSEQINEALTFNLSSTQRSVTIFRSTGTAWVATAA